nr:hypothetical protein JVH1_9238 [Rhodococcus sp. JVH1]
MLRRSLEDAPAGPRSVSSGVASGDAGVGVVIEILTSEGLRAE